MCSLSDAAIRDTSPPRQDALVAVEDLIEALSLDSTRTKALDTEMAVLEHRLAASLDRPMGELERQVKALCGLASIAADHLQGEHRRGARGPALQDGRCAGGDGLFQLVKLVALMQGARPGTLPVLSPATLRVRPLTPCAPSRCLGLTRRSRWAGAAAGVSGLFRRCLIGGRGSQEARRHAAYSPVLNPGDDSM